MSLLQVKKGQYATIKELACQGINHQRLIDLGINVGTKVKVIGFAPLGDPMVIEVDDCRIAIRKSDAKCLIIV